MILNCKYEHELKQKSLKYITKEIRDMTAIVIRGGEDKKEERRNKRYKDICRSIIKFIFYIGNSELKTCRFQKRNSRIK